jgi:hypothetical protein
MAPKLATTRVNYTVESFKFGNMRSDYNLDGNATGCGTDFKCDHSSKSNLGGKSDERSIS